MSSPSAHVKNTEYHTSVRAKVHTYYHDFHLSKHRVAEDLNLNRHTVQNLLDKSVRRQLTFRGRRSVLDSDDVQKMIRKATTDFSTRIFTWIDLAKVCDIDVSESIIKRAMHAAEYKKCKACRHPFITEVDALKRVF